MMRLARGKSVAIPPITVPPGPDDPPRVFFERLSLLSESEVVAVAERFRTYADRLPILKFHRAVSRRPEMNVRITYDSRRGWHASSCLWSLPLREPPEGEPCTCERDFGRPYVFFHRIENDLRLTEYWHKVLRNGTRCPLCKHWDVDWQEVPGHPRTGGASAHVLSKIKS